MDLFYTQVMKFKQILAVAILAAATSGCNLTKTDNTMKVTINNKQYTLEVARKEEEKIKGLGGRQSLDKNGGMIFFYDQPDYLNFWMKDTLIPLQILFINGCEIVDVQEMTVEKDPANPQKTYRSKSKADKAIELNKDSVPENMLGKEIEQLCN